MNYVCIFIWGRSIDQHYFQLKGLWVFHQCLFISSPQLKREKERERERLTERDREIQIDREREMDRERDSLRERDTDRSRERERETEREREIPVSKETWSLNNKSYWRETTPTLNALKMTIRFKLKTQFLERMDKEGWGNNIGNLWLGNDIHR